MGTFNPSPHPSGRLEWAHLTFISPLREARMGTFTLFIPLREARMSTFNLFYTSQGG